jgi:serine/threonine-protein kinase SRPK3
VEILSIIGGVLRIAKLPHTPIEKCLDTYKRLKPGELRPAADFMRRCLTIDPVTRPTANELLEDEWLKDV